MAASRLPSLPTSFVILASILALAQFYGTIELSTNYPETQTEIAALQEYSTLKSNNNNKLEDPYGTNCKQLLQNFLNGKIPQMEKDPGWEKSFVTRTITPKPFYWSTHKPDLDAVRGTSYEKGLYYEKQLTLRVQEIFDKKQGQESIFLDVGGNIGWFSLLAAAHGATKVFMF